MKLLPKIINVLEFIVLIALSVFGVICAWDADIQFAHDRLSSIIQSKTK